MNGDLLRLLTLEVRLEHDVVLCRQRARQLAGAFGFDTQEQTRVATAVSEIARHAFERARGGRIEFAVETASRKTPPRKGTPEQTLVITVREQGPGPLSGEHRRDPADLGLGLAGARRLLDGVEIATRAGVTTITARKSFPATVTLLSAPQLQAVVSRIAAEPPSDALAELQLQNQELMRTMEEVHRRQEDLARVNQELADTNSGVLALYDELETLHRVGGLLAAQLDLKTLLQAIIDATTDLTAAPFGAFFYRDEARGAWRLQSTAGPAREVLTRLSGSHGADFFGAVFMAEHGALADGGASETSSRHTSKFVDALGEAFDLQSCLTIPVTSDSEMLGAMVFGSDRAAAFTERSERIISSIAAQAAVGIEKARLFEKVQGSNAAKDRFLAMLSHELRTPLNPVLAVVSSLVSDARLPAETLQDLDIVLRNVRLEARLIDDLLDFSRISNGKLQLQREPLDLHALVRSVVDICAEDIAAGRHQVTLSLDAPRSIVLGDSARLQQVLWNVLKNAVKFTPVSGKISIHTALTGADTITVTVADNGVGIDKAALSRIFSAFEQGEIDTTARFGGLGLGLAITKAFVEMHCGTIQAASEGPGRGTQITIELPLFRQDEAPGPAAAAHTRVNAGERPTGTLLLVDDHADSLKIMGRLLTRQGYRVLLATSCQAALEIAREHRFDLIVSDLGLPDGSGLTLLGQLRIFCDVPAIALSGYGMEENVRQSRASGYNEHLTKPIDFSLLTLTIGHLLTRVG